MMIWKKKSITLKHNKLIKGLQTMLCNCLKYRENTESLKLKSCED